MQRGVDDAAAMTECLETFAAVVGSHSAVPDSSEGEVSVGGLYNGVVDTGSARCGVLYHVACPFFAAGKVVEGEGLFPVVDVFDTVVDVVEREERRRRLPAACRPGERRRISKFYPESA